MPGKLAWKDRLLHLCRLAALTVNCIQTQQCDQCSPQLGNCTCRTTRTIFASKMNTGVPCLLPQKLDSSVQAMVGSAAVALH